MKSPYSSRKKYHNPTRPNSSNNNNTPKDSRRPWRIFAIALIFVATALRRILFQGDEHSHFEFLTSLLLDNDVAVPREVSSTKYASAVDAHLIIFYNLYIPHDSEGVVNAINVIDDQMEQISSELHRIEGRIKDDDDNGNTKEKRGVVFYNLIGNEAAFPSDKMSDLCHKLHPRLECKLLKHYHEAGEAVTLQDVHDFCHSDHVIAKDDATNQNTTTRVVYLHSKGSYHSQPENHIWRRQMTSASLHPDCLNPPDDRCDVCGAQFYIKYAIMFPGNMWTAKCSYIRKLLPPNDNDGEYIRKKEEAVKRFLMLDLWGVLAATLDTSNVEHFGLDRYAWEHWIASSPHIQPCEVHSTEVGPLILLGKDPQGREFGPEYYDWGMAPRRITANLGGLRNPRLRLENNEERQFREYYYLPGNLIKWFTLYGSNGVPEQDSWVWRDFPAGQRWKELVGQHGEKAMDEMVKSSKPRFHSAFALNHTDTVVESSMTMLFDEETLSHSDPPVVVFYQISFPPDSKEKAIAAVKSQFDVLSMGQYDNATSTFDQSRKVLLYYTITGGSSQEIDFVAHLCKEKSNRIVCQPRGKYDAVGVHGEIFHQLHAFCNAKPSFNVIHITNRLPGYAHYKDMDQTFNVPKIQAITSAVTSKMCRPSEESCNVCGTEFYPLPFLHFTGNMFSASCGYVNNLLPPSTFERTMNDIAGDALLAQLQEIYTTKLIRFNPRILGSYQHSIEHWIGAHPDLKPCDVAPIMNTEKFDEPIPNQMKRYSWASAPRRGSAPPGYLADDSESKFRLKRNIALREYYYLAGNVFRWHRLYNKVPGGNSWVWQWFPDGQLWEAAARTSGEDAVNELGKHHSFSLKGLDAR